MTTKKITKMETKGDAINNISNEKEITRREFREYLNMISGVNCEIDDRLSYAVSKLILLNKKKSQDIDRAINDINIGFASTDKDGVLLRGEENRLRFTPENEREALKAVDTYMEGNIIMKTYIINEDKCKRAKEANMLVKMALEGILFNTVIENNLLD